MLAVLKLPLLPTVCMLAQGQVVWEGPTEEFDKSEEAIVQQFSQGSLEGPIKYL